MVFKDFARKIQPSALRIFVEIAQNVGQLQRPAERLRNAMSGGAGVAEYMNREMTDGTRHPGAIEVKRSEVRGADVLARIHFHAVDHGEKILAAQIVLPHRFVQSPGNELARMPGIKCRNFIAPGIKCGELYPDRRSPSAISSTSRHQA